MPSHNWVMNPDFVSNSYEVGGEGCMWASRTTNHMNECKTDKWIFYFMQVRIILVEGLRISVHLLMIPKSAAMCSVIVFSLEYPLLLNTDSVRQVEFWAKLQC